MDARWLARVAASAAVRRVVYLVIAAVLGLFAMSGKAHAQSYPDCSNYSVDRAGCPSRQAAYEHAHGGALALNEVPSYPGVGDCTYLPISGGMEYQCLYRTGGGSKTFKRWHRTNEECPAGNVWNDDLKECAASACQDAPDYGSAMSGSLYMCNNGCRYEMGSNEGLSICMGDGLDMKCMGSNWTPTGGACKANDKPPTSFNPQMETCRTTDETGSHQECVKPNGDHCVTSAKGAVLCWKPGDMGGRTTTDGKFGGDRKQAPDTPTPPENMKDPTEVSTTTTTINGDTYNTSIYTGTGNNGGQGNVGEGGNDTGGTGDPKGEGEGGDGEGEGDGPGEVGAGVGTLYEGTGKTVASVFADFKTQVEAAPIVSAVDGFLTVSVSASCPAFSLPETAFWPAMSFDHHCSGELADALALGGYLLMAIAAFLAAIKAFG